MTCATFTHVAYMSRIDPESAAEAYIRLIGYAGATGAHMHICHFNSSSKTDIERCAVLIAKAQAQGLPITVEAYPYGTGSTVLAAAFFSDPEFEARNGTRLRFGAARDRRAALPRPRGTAGGAGRGALHAGAVAHPGYREQPAPSRPAGHVGAVSRRRDRVRRDAVDAVGRQRSTPATPGRCRTTPPRIRARPVASPASSANGCASARRCRCWKASANAR